MIMKNKNLTFIQNNGLIKQLITIMQFNNTFIYQFFLRKTNKLDFINEGKMKLKYFIA